MVIFIINYFVFCEGLAPVAGMCTTTSSCTVNEGRHFESVYVVAHEIGHKWVLFLYWFLFYHHHFYLLSFVELFSLFQKLLSKKPASFQ